MTKSHLKNFKLEEIKDFLQDLINTVSALINAELAIVDKDMIVLAGTQKYQHIIGQKSIPYIYEALYKKKDILVIDNPMEHEVCSVCNQKEACAEFAGINTPLMLDNEIIGGMSIVALNTVQKEALIRSLENYIKFSKQMVELIQDKIRKHLLTKELDFTTKQLESIINYSTEGIILLDNKGRIKVINNYCCKMFNIKHKEVLNQPFELIFKNETVNKLLADKTDFETIESTIKVFGDTYRIIHSGKHIKVDSDLSSFLWFLKDAKSFNALVNRFIINKEDITFDEIIGECSEFRKLKDRLFSIANSSSTVLIQGESGTGKELFARAIHNASDRAQKPFISINCGAIPENLIESELYGYEGGAFTGAKSKGKPGKFELANGGTLFLDEIGDMPLHMQVKLLRALEDKEIYRLGGIEGINVDVRIIAATNKNLEVMVKEKEFREDLFYRLNVIPVKIPPLRERGEKDIEILTKFFVEKYSETLNKDIKEIAEETLINLKEYSWPGNVRELENAIEFAVNIDNDGIITIDDLPKRLKNLTNSKSRITPVDDLIKQEVNKALKLYGTSVEGKNRAASSLGISIATLYRWIKR